MTVTLTTRAPKELAKKIEEMARRYSVDKSTMLRRLLSDAVEIKTQQEAIKLYKEGKVSLWKAAKLARLSLWEMMDLIAKEGIYLDYGLKELKEDLEPLRRKMRARSQ